MIPKRIHFCWFGGGDMNQISKQCIDSWKEKLIDYEIVEWNEENFDVTLNPYVEEAYRNKKYAFVTDYVRLHALYEYGGIYMDTDVEVIKDFGVLLEHRAFTGVERGVHCVTGTIAAEAKHPWVKLLLENYNSDKRFVLEDGGLDLTPNTVVITELTKKQYGWTEGNKKTILNDDIHIYPFDYFCAKDGRTNKYYLTENTYTIHHFNGSWLPKYKKPIIRLLRIVRNIMKVKVK